MSEMNKIGVRSGVLLEPLRYAQAPLLPYIRRLGFLPEVDLKESTAEFRRLNSANFFVVD